MSQLDGWLLPRAVQKPAPHKVVAIGGDGIGPEVIAAAVRCLIATGAPVEIQQPAHGAQTLASSGTAFPPEVKAAILAADATLYGASGGVSNDILRFLRFHLDTFANVRPTLSLAGVPALTGRGRTNLVLVRELTEGMYPGREGKLEDLVPRWPEFRDRLGRALPAKGKFALRVTTEEATTRIARYAANLAAHRKLLGHGPGRVTIVTKSNVLPVTDGLFHEVCEREIKQVADLSCDHLYVDEAARRLVAKPESFDVIVTSNLFGDILSDVAAEAMGGMPMSPSAGIGDRIAYFEPVHGSAPDIAGTGKANPSGAILSAAMMLSYLGHPDHARRLMTAVTSTLARGCLTSDMGGEQTTASFTEAVLEALR